MMLFNFQLKRQLQAYRPDLYRVALSWCGDADLADDLVQDCLIKAWQKHRQLKDESKLKAWLFRILHNLWLEHLRQKKPLADLNEVPADLSHVLEDQIEQQQLVQRVRAAVQKLPVGQREVLTLVDLQEFRYAEVAEILDIPIGTVMSRLSRARQQLKAELLSQRHWQSHHLGRI